MERLEIWSRHFTPASTWNELTRAQLGEVVHVLYGPEHFWPARLRLLSIVSGAPLELLTDLPVLQVKQLYSLTDFIYSDEHRLTRQLLPELRLPARVDRKQRRWMGAGDNLSGVSFGEFIFADTYFCAYARHQAPEALSHFIASLYRPARRKGPRPGDADWSGDVREAFNEHNIEYHARVLRWLPEVDQLSIYLWYRGCRAQLQADFPQVFEAAETDTRRHQKGDWGRVLRSLSGDTFGPLEQTARQSARTVLAELCDLAREARHLNSTSSR
ncbi:hypothetical protein [Hymenobacter psychrotolerans]|uniref:Uncharacterized protein n=1 Tax=Hymenobacter psychrotolerans DSM 18569 TaxID=1121959 RepID=A0A1M7E874_9BACT|nr:hypothetical protein [Hymenobacter psychrotolerans]SHL87937.1 hypothetical protein SAMN02746009_03549 [Hymenobacter psychrotolerans DSM 18569]